MVCGGFKFHFLDGVTYNLCYNFILENLEKKARLKRTLGKSLNGMSMSVQICRYLCTQGFLWLALLFPISGWNKKKLVSLYFVTIMLLAF